MKLLPSIDNPQLYGWIVLLIMLITAILAAIVVYVGSLLFGNKKRRHKSRRRRGNSPPGPEVARTNGTPSALNRENAPGETRS